MAFPLTLPTGTEFRGASFALTRRTDVVRSIFTGKPKASENPYALWQFTGALAITGGEEQLTREWRALIVELRGQLGTFKLPVPGYSGPSTGYTGPIPLVMGINQLGTSLLIDGGSNSTPFINRGDYFSFNNELKLSLSSVSFNGVGQATLDFEPAIRFSPPDNDPVEYASPEAVMRLLSDTVGWSLSPPVLHDINFEALEAF